MLKQRNPRLWEIRSRSKRRSQSRASTLHEEPERRRVASSPLKIQKKVKEVLDKLPMNPCKLSQVKAPRRPSLMQPLSPKNR